ncbi:hypothetical protein LVJ83_04765 [Uruburuella testudinis]|uniref:Uncharacterized protein n=1 Tax=Uruburuella testudinis TaxID=1282863 RepID=A0ABY4DVB3_9NEIS|nr:hypothetical protein [Uruburuella testudinis]UOO82781.1 hypothetical protein LVJ83_04765 [Uruburuella testudinis]
MERNLNWLKQAIAQGFVMLAALNLKGRPAAADLKAVAVLWFNILKRHDWQPERDVARIQTAFETIAATAGEWPNPKDLTDALPAAPVKMVPKLEKKHRPTEHGRQQLTTLKQKLAELKTAPCMNRDWIHGQPHRTVDECKQIYAMKQQKKESEND